MAVLIVADVEGQTADKYDAMMVTLRPLLEAAPGFIAHGAGTAAGGWRTFEVWASAAHATDFFARYIYPNLPPDVKPKRSIVELHTLMFGSHAAELWQA